MQPPKKLKEPVLLIAERFGKFYWRVLPGCPTPSAREPFGVCQTWNEAKQAGDSYLADYHICQIAPPFSACTMPAHNVSVGI